MSEGVEKAPGVANARVVVSNTSAGFHLVSLDRKGCAHLLAVGYYEKCLLHPIKKYQPNISSIVKPSKKAGTKPNQLVRKRKAPSDDRCNVAQYSDPLDSCNLSTPPPSEKWNVVFVKDTQMRKCYGCSGNVRQNVNFDPLQPWNIVLIRREYQTFTMRRKSYLTISAKKDVYYHPRK